MYNIVGTPTKRWESTGFFSTQTGHKNYRENNSPFNAMGFLSINHALTIFEC